ncbi:hypothetical protein A2U01_0076783, partial [Trifolium medium]|nr:hypothetical protein [Trifolium medium]
HTLDICYKKHGYPPNWGYARGNNGGNTYVNNVEAGNGNEGINNSSTLAANEDNGNVSLTKDQYNSLLALLERNVTTHFPYPYFPECYFIY